VKRGRGVSALLLVAVISACGGQASKTSASKSSSASPTASATSTEAASPTASTAGTPAPQGLNCKLPVVTDPSGGGWLTFPAGTFQADPKANVNLPTPTFFPLSRSYDKAFERWLPVPRDWISPDGKHYAYPELPPADSHGSIPPGGVHIVDIASGADHFFTPSTPPPTDSFWWVLDYETEGVYIAYQPNGPAPPTGLWQLDPSTGAVRKVTDAIQSQYISGGAAWSTADALTGHGPGPGSRLLRTDLKTGEQVSWYKRTDVEFTVAGADSAGHPILQTWKYQTPQLLLITGANSATILLTAPGSAVPSLSNIIHPVADSHGIWFGDAGGSISLYTPATGIKKMAQVGSGNVTAGGGCH
jgi:hypothetical protein